MNFSSLTNFSWSGSWDWLMVLIFLVVVLVYGLSLGKNRLVVIILGIYFSFLITNFFPWQSFGLADGNGMPSSTVLIFVFLAIILGFYFLIPHSALGSALRLRGRARSNWWQSILLSFLQIGLIFAVVINFLPDNIISGLSPLAKTLFVGQIQRFLWLFLPILAIMFLRSRTYEIGE